MYTEPMALTGNICFIYKDFLNWLVSFSLGKFREYDACRNVIRVVCPQTIGRRNLNGCPLKETPKGNFNLCIM